MKKIPLILLYVTEELKLKRKKEMKKDNASRIKAMVDEVKSMFHKSILCMPLRLVYSYALG